MKLAKALRSWLPLVLHYAEPWFSAVDISAGKRWSAELAVQLEASSFGILCLTRENVLAPWILFEAGAIAKVVAMSAVCPYLLDLDFQDLSGPLAQYQAKKAEKVPTYELVKAINGLAERPVDPDRLSQLFEVCWPQLLLEIESLATIPESENPLRSSGEILEDLVSLVRQVERRLGSLEEVAGKLISGGQSSESLPAPKGSVASPLQAAADAAAVEEARRLARLLISEIKIYNEEEVEEGRKSCDLMKRLGVEIENAQSKYQEILSKSMREDAGYFRAELVRILAAGDEAALGLEESQFCCKPEE